jgi:hypothetical protein
MIQENLLLDDAEKLGVEVAVIKAVIDVESKGSAFLKTGEPKILFEPHIFWKELRKVGINPHNHRSDICYPRWGTKKYGKYSDQHKKLAQAVKIHREAALKSCSWGLFQIMGFNYKLCGESLQGFINKMYKNENAQLELFTNFIINSYLDDELQEKDWSGFARGYNGPSYYKHNYHGRLKKAYLKHKEK